MKRITVHSTGSTTMTLELEAEDAAIFLPNLNAARGKDVPYQVVACNKTVWIDPRNIFAVVVPSDDEVAF